MIAAVIRPTEGRMLVSGKIVPLIELCAGFDDELTRAENIYLNASILGLSREEIGRIFPRLWNSLGCGTSSIPPLRVIPSGW